MNKVNELTYFKTSKGWTVKDRNGNSGSGITKQLAELDYNLHHNIDTSYVNGADKYLKDITRG